MYIVSLILPILSVKRSGHFYSEGGLNACKRFDTKRNYWYKHEEHHNEGQDKTRGEQLVTF